MTSECKTCNGLGTEVVSYNNNFTIEPCSDCSTKLNNSVVQWNPMQPVKYILKDYNPITFRGFRFGNDTLWNRFWNRIYENWIFHTWD